MTALAVPLLGTGENRLTYPKSTTKALEDPHCSRFICEGQVCWGHPFGKELTEWTDPV